MVLILEIEFILLGIVDNFTITVPVIGNSSELTFSLL